MRIKRMHWNRIRERYMYIMGRNIQQHRIDEDYIINIWVYPMMSNMEKILHTFVHKGRTGERNTTLFVKRYSVRPSPFLFSHTLSHAHLCHFRDIFNVKAFNINLPFLKPPYEGTNCRLHNILWFYERRIKCVCCVFQFSPHFPSPTARFYCNDEWKKWSEEKKCLHIIEL